MDDRTILRMLYERDESVLGEIRKTHDSRLFFVFEI